tara:strand:- start:912 stop:1118 length:207 start_codon:yes stop_codon:yes gene_type:complete
MKELYKRFYSENAQSHSDRDITLAQLELAKEATLLIVRDCPDQVKSTLDSCFSELIKDINVFEELVDE